MRKHLGAVLPGLLSVALFGVAVFWFVLPSTEEAIMKKKRETIQEMTRIVFHLLTSYQAEVADGRLTLELAQQRAKSRIKSLRYGSSERDYFWLMDLEGRPLAHPYRPDHEGRDMSGLTDARGKLFIKEFTEIARTRGQGYTTYVWQWMDDASRHEEKLSYVRLFEPWGWVVGTGMYLDDVKSEIAQMTKALTWVGAGVFFVVTLLSIYLAWREYRLDLGRDAAEQAMRETYERLSTVLNSAPNPIVVYDTQGKAIYINPAFTRVFGWPPEEIIGRKIDYVPPEEQERAARAVAQAYASKGKVVVVDGRRRTKSGGELEVSMSGAVFLNSAGEPAGMVACITDISLVKRAEQALAESEEIFRALAENSLDVIARFGRDGRILYVNPMGDKLCGQGAGGCLGKTSREIGLPAEAAQALEEAVRRILDDHRPLRLELLTQEGAWLDCQLVPEFDALGQVKAVMASARDVSERRRLESQLRQAQKMEAIGALAGGIAHDFNNIVGAISGYTELALLTTGGEDPKRHHLDQVQKACQRARDLIRQILTLSRSAVESQAPVQLDVIAGEVLQLIRATMPANIEIEAELACPCVVLADPTQMHQMILNLCANAGQAMAERQGRLRVSLDEVSLEQGEAAPAPELAPGRYARLRVCDNGPGIDPAVIDRIFEPFFTTKEQQMGTGLGLSVVHGIVAKLGGHVQVESAPGQGAAFTVLLPLMVGRVIPASHAPETAIPRGHESILLVDDEAALAETGGQMLEILGYRVRAVTSSLQALAAFAADPETFDLVITDQGMPEMNGMDLARAIGEIRPQTPVILCTGFLGQLPEDATAPPGLRKIVFKPFTSRELGLAVREVLDGEDRGQGTGWA